MSQTRYVFIESRDPFDSADAAFVPDMATALQARGRPVTVFLVQNGVLATRTLARGSQVPRLVGAGVSVLADDFSLRERGIEEGELSSGVHAAPIERLVDLIVRPDTKTLWH